MARRTEMGARSCAGGRDIDSSPRKHGLTARIRLKSSGFGSVKQGLVARVGDSAMGSAFGFGGGVCTKSISLNYSNHHEKTSCIARPRERRQSGAGRGRRPEGCGKQNRHVRRLPRHSGLQATFPEVFPVPKIGGQSAKYIESALKAYQKGDRKNPSMVGIARGLSDQDIADIAAYYSQQK